MEKIYGREINGINQGSYLKKRRVWCHHHQIGMDYHLYDAIFKMAASEVKLRFRLWLGI